MRDRPGCEQQKTLPSFSPRWRDQGSWSVISLTNIMGIWGSQILNLLLGRLLIHRWSKWHEPFLNMGLNMKAIGLLKNSWRTLRMQSKLRSTNIQPARTLYVGFSTRAAATGHSQNVLSMQNGWMCGQEVHSRKWGTVWAGQVQKMTKDDGTPKGMKMILEERGINTSSMKADDMKIVLSLHDDFRTEKTLVEKFLIDEGHKVMFLPKFHCELNPIERVWGQAKCYSWQYTNYTLVRLRKIVNLALDSVTTDLKRKYFRKVGDYEKAYIEGKKAGKEVESAVEVYKSHCRVFFESN